MKNLQRAETDRAWIAADADVASQIGALFDRCPELCGFSVQVKVSADGNPGAGEHPVAAPTSVAPRLTKEQYGEISEQIPGALTDLRGERPEAATLLRG